jgi:hypothetical protein
MRFGKRRALVLAAASACLLALPFVGVAQATPAPSCVQVNVHEEDSPDWASVSNHCSTAQRVKVVIEGDFDSACTYLHVLGEGQSGFTYPWYDWGSFDGLELC